MFPKITIAIVCFNEEENISNCLSSLLKQSYDKRLFEVLCVDNGSTDRTQEIIRDWQKKKANLRLIVNPKRGISTSRNVALRQTQGNFVAFTDADCVAPKDWLKKLVAGYQKYKKKDPKVVAVGGSNIPPQDKRFHQVLGLMMDSFWGTRNSVQGRVFLKDRFVPHLPCVNVLHEKETIKKIGGFNEKEFNFMIEDEDLSYRLQKAGYKHVYLANNSVWHRQVDNLSQWMRRMIAYGKGRARFIKKYPETTKIWFLGPPILVITTILGLLPVFRWLLAFPFIYLLITLIFSFQKCLRVAKPSLVFDLFWLYLVTHYAYGIGELREAMNF